MTNHVLTEWDLRFVEHCKYVIKQLGLSCVMWDERLENEGFFEDRPFYESDPTPGEYSQMFLESILRIAATENFNSGLTIESLQNLLSQIQSKSFLSLPTVLVEERQIVTPLSVPISKIDVAILWDCFEDEGFVSRTDNGEREEPRDLENSTLLSILIFCSRVSLLFDHLRISSEPILGIGTNIQIEDVRVNEKSKKAWLGEGDKSEKTISELTYESFELSKICRQLAAVYTELGEPSFRHRKDGLCGLTAWLLATELGVIDCVNIVGRVNVLKAVSLAVGLSKGAVKNAISKGKQSGVPTLKDSDDDMKSKVSRYLEIARKIE